MEIVNIDWKNMPREELKKMVMELFRVNAVEANFYIALARKEIQGDLLPVDENGNEIHFSKE